MMTPKSMDDKVQKAFSRAAADYDEQTKLHKQIGWQLIQKVSQIQMDCNRVVLDIGMGTGWLTDHLTRLFPTAHIVGLDFSQGMIHHAQKQSGQYSIVQADINALPFQADVLDIILSNLAFQWIDDLSHAFSLCFNSLKRPGYFCVTLFGQKTLQELFKTIIACDEKKVFLKIQPLRQLPSILDVRTSLKEAKFDHVDVHSREMQIGFADMMSLLKWIKRIGANRLNPDVAIGKNFLLKANDYYAENFKSPKGVYATFEVIWAEGRK